MLSREDWVVAGQGLLREGGIPAVKLSALTDRLKVTSGSFYHHFKDFAGYLDALADYYGTDNVEAIRAIAEAEPDPRKRLYRLQELAVEWDINRLDVAMRVWATTSDRARSSIAALDRAFLDVAEQVFEDLGWPRKEARLRAAVTYAAGVGHQLVFAPGFASADDAYRALDLLVVPAGDRVG